MQALQERVSQAVREDPSIDRAISVTGLNAFLSSNQGLTYIFLGGGEKRPPVAAVAGRLMGRIAAIPGVFPFLRPYPVLQISTGATSQNQGQYAFSLSGVNPDQVYEAAGKLMEKLRPYPGFATLSSDWFNHTPNLEIDILREQAKILGVSETRILALLRNAYSQNYQYLIKKADDQYQVILEVKQGEVTSLERNAGTLMQEGCLDEALSVVRQILDEAGRHLNEDGGLLCEIGRGRALIERAYPDKRFLWLDTEASSGEVFWLDADQLQ